MTRIFPRSALVTGGAKRVGRVIAERMAQAGYSIVIHYHRSQSEAEETVSRCRKEGVKAYALGADLADENQTKTLIRLAIDHMGPLGVLINNASIFERDEVMEDGCALWESHMAINLRAPFLLSHDLAKYIMAQGYQGCILNMLDERVWRLTPHFVSYLVSKSSLWTLTRILAMALAPHIRVNGIGPGHTLPSLYQTKEQFIEQSQRMPLQRGTTPEEIADTVLFLLESPAITGQMIALDGGQHLAWAQPGGVDHELA